MGSNPFIQYFCITHPINEENVVWLLKCKNFIHTIFKAIQTEYFIYALKFN